MSVYLIGQIDIHDRDRYAQYEAGFLEAFAPHNGKVLSVDEDPTIIEGEWSATRTVLIEFPTKDEAMAWYDSDAYQAIVGHRHAAATANIALVPSFSIPGHGSNKP